MLGLVLGFWNSFRNLDLEFFPEDSFLSSSESFDGVGGKGSGGGRISMWLSEGEGSGSFFGGEEYGFWIVWDFSLLFSIIVLLMASWISTDGSSNWDRLSAIGL